MLAVASRAVRDRSAKAATARRLDHEDVAGVHLCGMGRTEILGAAVDALDPVLAFCARLTAREAEWRDDAMVREQHRRHRLEKTHTALRAVATAVTPCSARTVADAKLLQAHREAPLQYFRIGETRVRHVRLDDRRAVEIRSGARAAGDRFVVLMHAVTEGEVVHRALTGRE